PALAVAQMLKSDGIDVFWLGTRQGIEARVVPENEIDVEWISISGIKGKGLLALFTAPFKIIFAMIQTAVIIYRRRPEAALGMGGFVSGPGGLTVKLLMLPLLIHESNAVAGLTNKWLAKISNEVLVGFPDVLKKQHHYHYVGNPVRQSIAKLPAPDSRLEGRTGRLHLLIVGGSLGAQVLNETVPAALAVMDPSGRPEVRHQAGKGKLEATKESYQTHSIEASCTEFIDDMAAAYMWADVVICRAGAMTVAEIAAAGVAAIFVPYPYAIYDHQTLNARFLANKNAAIVIPQDRFSDETLSSVLAELSNDRACVMGLSRRARKSAKADATRRVADICKEVMYA
ncbi:MAG: undecaprenyldiphospho-muramoylpentapeptide beta-N-acetylglucosaminyltransferase, partial [Gammaproteobacteria bacterium]|nr:undecaprenyldiphospho-muramoylpentapeptide beta-N-acetylglucosaminyltransferase [Gammaproteobacteria bacterium]